jgi:hypothetical protein
VIDAWKKVSDVYLDETIPIIYIKKISKKGQAPKKFSNNV